MSQNEVQQEGQPIPDLTQELWTEAGAALNNVLKSDGEKIKDAVKQDLEKLAMIQAGVYEPAEEEVPVPKQVSEMKVWLDNIRKLEAEAEEQASKEKAEAEARAKAEVEEAERQRRAADKELGDSVALYILMRTDLAQGSHATNLFEKAVKTLRTGFPEAPNVLAYDAWASDRGFGTAITLAVNGAQLTELTNQAIEMGCIAGICTDPTYPLRDGEVVHLLNLDTCSYIFGNRENLAEILGSLSLMY
jgi:uncharacterized protein YlaN (UPF0358 family)